MLDLLQTRVFRASDFFETRQGVCRVLPPLTHALAETATLWAQRVAPVAEWAAEMFAAAPGSRIRKIPTLLTQAHRSTGRDRLRRKPRKLPRSPKPMPAGICHFCGAILASSERSYCDECLGARRMEVAAAFQRAGSAALSRLIGKGHDPAHGGEAGRKRGATVGQRNKEVREWDERHARPDPSEFARTILPSLQGVALQRMVEATGLSLRYCSQIRRGLYVPHPRHWEALKSLVIFKEDLYGAKIPESTGA